MTPEIDLATRLEESLRGLGERFKVELVDKDWLGQHNLTAVPVDGKVECIDERPLKFKPAPRLSTKFPGASLGEAVLSAIKDRRSVTGILKDQLWRDQPVDFHDDDHHRHEWPEADGNVTGCGFHDKLALIIGRFLVLDKKIPEQQRPLVVDLVTGHQTSAHRIQELIKKGAAVSATYAGEHAGRRLVINPIAGMTLDHLNPDGERSFVVDAGSAANPEKMMKLAVAAVDVLLQPGIRIELAVFRGGG